jgi:hypothetical protein
MFEALIGFVIGVVAGYGVREIVSRKRRRKHATALLP